MMAKGASRDEAIRLANLNRVERKRKSSDGQVTHSFSENETNAASDDDDEENFLRKYRAMRLEQLKSTPKFGEVIPISRTEWSKEVNESSTKSWVLILLHSQNSSPASIPLHLEICRLVENVIYTELARKFHNIKFVTIPSRSAIPNWPDANLPAIFCYRHGALQHQMVGLQDFGYGIPTTEQVEWKLAMRGVLKTDLNEEPLPEKNHISSLDNVSIDGKKEFSRSQFNGGMATLHTSRNKYDDGNEDDYDDVD
mmetsp:Transcript_8612/g.12268  ORF Transcript_8612/g.12268 Transcript_8612/m.12268 type:complete len:254 (+) Transcript_8612:50-811(+)